MEVGVVVEDRGSVRRVDRPWSMWGLAVVCRTWRERTAVGVRNKGRELNNISSRC